MGYLTAVVVSPGTRHRRIHRRFRVSYCLYHLPWLWSQHTIPKHFNNITVSQSLNWITFISQLQLQMWAGIAQSVQPLATGWTVRGSNFGAGEIFGTRPERPWGPPSLRWNGHRALFPHIERLGCSFSQPSPFKAEVKERVELYLYSLYGPSLSVLGQTLRLRL